MTMRFAFPAPEAAPRGGAPVGHLREMGAVEQAAVLCLRGWCDGANRDTIADSLRLSLGREAGADAVADLDALMRVATRGARRPLMRHAFDCRCVGGDECAFAQMMAAAAMRDDEEATLFACTLLRGPAVFEAVRLAGAFGPALLGMTRGGAIDRPSPSEFAH